MGISGYKRWLEDTFPEIFTLVHANGGTIRSLRGR
jgi:hypothetical protein